MNIRYVVCQAMISGKSKIEYNKEMQRFDSLREAEDYIRMKLKEKNIVCVIQKEYYNNK